MVVGFALALFLLVLLVPDFYLLAIHLRARSLQKGLESETAQPDFAMPPIVAVQLAIYNEPLTAIFGALQALAALDWPRSAFEIMVLDDSDDATGA